jgi:hypothetical protein
MVVGVDQPRQHHLPAAAEHRDPGIFCDHLGGGAADLRDPTATSIYAEKQVDLWLKKR